MKVTLLQKFVVNLFLLFSGTVPVKRFICSVIHMQSPMPRGSPEKVRRRRKLLLDMCPMWWLSGKNILLWIFNFWTKNEVRYEHFDRFFSTFQILDSEDDTRCKKCPPGELPDSKKLNCTKLPEEYMTLTSYWAMGSQSFALLGIILTVAVIIVFLKYNDTPVVRASGRELSYVLLFGLLFCYLVTFLFVIRPTTIICAIEQFSIGLCFSVVYGALFIKTNRISRIFAASKKTSKRPNFISPKSQLIMCSGIVFVQVLINIIWFLVSPPEADYYRPIPETNILACKVIYKMW